MARHTRPRPGKCHWILFLLLAAQAAVADAAQKNSCGTRAPDDTRPRVGLALGGGGARGIAHVSVLKAIEQAGVKVDCVAGTSMGSLVGALYATGQTPAEIEQQVLSIDWDRLFNDSLERRERSYRRKADDRLAVNSIGVGVEKGRLKLTTGVLAGQRILMLFERMTLPVSGIDHFDRLPIPYRAVATDINTAEPVVIDHGSLALAMRASMSLPGIFNPVEIDGRVLVDGGLVNQVPVDVVRDMGADVVIAVDVGTPLEKLDVDASLVAVLNQMTGMLTTGNTRARLATLGNRDILIVPALGKDVGTSDFTKGKQALEIGAKAAASAMPRLASLAREQGSADPMLAAQPAPKHAPTPAAIEFVRLDNRTGYDDAFFLDRLDVPLGQPLDVDDLEQQLQRIYGTETFALVSYQVVEENGRRGMVVQAQPKPQGPVYLQAGLSVDSDFEGTSNTNLRVGLLFAPVSSYGAEARILAQIGNEPALAATYFHPFDPRNRNNLFAAAEFLNPQINVFDTEGNNTATYATHLGALEAAWVREFGNYGAAQIGIRRGAGEAEVQTGDPDLPDLNFQVGEVAAVVTVDRLDSVYFPRDGYFGRLGYKRSDEALGADTDFDQLDLDVVYAHRFGLHAIELGARYHSTISGVAPIQSIYRLGGRGRLVGFRSNELTGQNYAILLGGYVYELADVFGRPALLASTLEYGNAWQQRDDMSLTDGIWNGSVYFGFDSWLGPVMFGVGAREGGKGTVFLQISDQF
ncbi:NTE family protein [Lysobacter niastensis]|uniref:NTE family protein n=1 Tax=Lysobacter niastensis TaxID=380629 RepID=A0ABU1WET3_9GAMM|nr:patatin-like phospholipase family protein [Lysobacter niastensis]MDR7135915.1 NTE family protein [Lysobacter niastensis]